MLIDCKQLIIFVREKYVLNTHDLTWVYNCTFIGSQIINFQQLQHCNCTEKITRNRKPHKHQKHLGSQPLTEFFNRDSQSSQTIDIKKLKKKFHQQTSQTIDRKKLQIFKDSQASQTTDSREPRFSDSQASQIFDIGKLLIFRYSQPSQTTDIKKPKIFYRLTSLTNY